MRNLTPAYEMIKKFEGLYLKAYLDPVQIPTIGWGTIKYPNGQKVKMGDVITKEQAQAYLEHEVNKFAEAIEKLVKVACNDNQFCALVSFAYNVGSGALASSTLLKKLNAGDYIGASNEFARWNKAGGKVLKGLTRRREDEKNLFLTPVHTVSEKADEVTAPLEAELDKDVVEIPSWFTPFKELLEKLLNYFLVDHKADATVAPDDVETGAPTKAGLVSEGTGPRITDVKVREIVKANGGDTDKVSLLAIRGYYLDTYGKKGENDRGIYDDALIWVWKDGFYTFRGNTDPSRVRKGSGFGASKGMANVKVGRWPGYYPGMHNGSVPHLAYRQGKPITVVRDGSPDYENTGMFGCNVHRGGVNGTSSLGCLTLPPAVWALFKSTGDSQLARFGQKEFDLILVNETDLRAGKLKA